MIGGIRENILDNPLGQSAAFLICFQNDLDADAQAYIFAQCSDTKAVINSDDLLDK